jgi:hypothetical protein
MSKKPDFNLCVQPVGVSGAWHHVGAAWLADNGNGMVVKLDWGVNLRWDDQLSIRLFRNEPKPSKEKP